MNLSTQEFMFERQRIRQWVPLITQQYRLRHVYQIMGINLGADGVGRFYYTLHLTTMCAPFYTSEEVTNPNPKWAELNLKDMPNLSASCIALRIWQHSKDEADKILVTWGINFSGLCYIGNKISDIQPYFFKKNTVIFCMQGGFYTSHQVIRTDLKKPIPFLYNINIIDTKNKVMYKRVAVKTCSQEVQHSYSIEKLRQLQQLQVQIRNREADVQNIRDKINVLNGIASREKDTSLMPASLTNIRYAPQLLTMNSLNKMLQLKPTHIQKQEMAKISKELEIAKFKTKLLSQEKDKKTVIIRSLKQKYTDVLENNEERNSDLMENYHQLSRGTEKLKEYKQNIVHHREMYSNIHSQLQQRRRQLLKELLFIFPIEKISEDKYSVIGIPLPNSDVLADSTDSGLSVALGYIAHIVIMCSTFLQVPIRYPITHYGSISFITDNISPLFPEKERHFPLYTRGKEKIQFIYAVYLLNKNIAQFRWLFCMNTTDLKATLHNLLTFLQNPRDIKLDTQKKVLPSLEKKLEMEQFVSLRSFTSISNVSDPLLDCIRMENRLERSHSPSRVDKKPGGKKCGECGKGLSEILAVPEAYLNRQISSDSFRSFMAKGKRKEETGSVCCGSSPIKITNGKEMLLTNSKKQTLVEQGYDPLASTSSSLPIVRTINSDTNLRQTEGDCNSYGNKRISRSVGSYSDEDTGLVLSSNFENKEVQKECTYNGLENDPSFLFSSEETLSDPQGTAGLEKSPLMARTNALNTTTTFNLVRPK